MDSNTKFSTKYIPHKTTLRSLAKTPAQTKLTVFELKPDQEVIYMTGKKDRLALDKKKTLDTVTEINKKYGHAIGVRNKDKVTVLFSIHRRHFCDKPKRMTLKSLREKLKEGNNFLVVDHHSYPNHKNPDNKVDWFILTKKDNLDEEDEKVSTVSLEKEETFSVDCKSDEETSESA